MSVVEALAPFEAEVPGAPPSEFMVAPATVEEAATVMDLASENGMRVLHWGGGTHQGYGHPVDADVVLSTQRLNRIVDWSPDDLVVVAEAGVRVADLEERLAERGQTAVLAERPGASTVGGAVAAGITGWRRLRYGPIRDRVLETVLATGDGRVVRAGGRVVKNVSGYDISRLATGSMGALGLIGSVALKLWPSASCARTVDVDHPDEALRLAYRPLAVIETESAAQVFFAGTEEGVAEQTAVLGGRTHLGHLWPEALATPTVVVARVPAAKVASVVALLAPSWRFRAAHGVGEIRIGMEQSAPEEVEALRHEVELLGGALVVERAGPDLEDRLDPWGTPPPSLELQRRVKAAFDPLRVSNPGRLPGRL